MKEPLVRDRFAVLASLTLGPSGRILAVGLALACATSGVEARTRDGGASTGLRGIAYAKPPPDFVFAAANGPSRLATRVGKPVVLVFWATWCEPCRAELEAFTQLRARYGDAVDVIMISDEAPGVARSYLKSHDVVAEAVEDPARVIFDLYAITPIPTTLVLAPSGSVSYVSVGEVSWPELSVAVTTTLDPTVRI